jgi:hypothetical protein
MRCYTGAMPTPRFSKLRSLSAIAAMATCAAVLVGGCGGSGTPSSSGSNGGQHKTTAADVAKYPDCMRQHGVTNFPDPQVSGNRVTIQIDPTITGSPAFKSARQACAYLLPPGAGDLDNTLTPGQLKARTEGLLAFANCMRNHGFRGFPDPDAQGRLTVSMVTQAGIDLKQPAVLRAGDACVPTSRGQITRADVAQAVSNPSGSG